MDKFTTKFLQGSAVTQTTLGGLTVAMFPLCMCAKNYGSWLAVDKVIAVIKLAPFLWLTV